MYILQSETPLDVEAKKAVALESARKARCKKFFFIVSVITLKSSGNFYLRIFCMPSRYDPSSRNW